MLNETRTHSRVYFMEPPMEGMQGPSSPGRHRDQVGRGRSGRSSGGVSKASFAEDEFIQTTGMRSGIVVPFCTGAR